jgi:F0F1-type ATP synthase assembly protein I
MGYYLTLAQAGMEMVAPLVLGLIIDYYAGSRPWFTVGGLILGFVGSLMHIVLLTNRHDKAKSDKNKPGNGEA